MNLSIMIKPASSLCNLRCRYCFYSDLAENRAQASYGIMREGTLRQLLLRAFEAMGEARGKLSLIFQGGEPMTAGIEFYRTLERLLTELKPPEIHVERSVQTNGTLINDEWAAFFARYHYLLGVSLDGAADVQNDLRADRQGKGSYNRVMAGIACLKKHKVEFNILTVVTARTARHGRSLYRFLRKNGWEYLQFIPCMDPIDGRREDYSLSPEQYGGFLKETFQEYDSELRQGRFVSVRWFDNLLEMAAGYRPESCGMTGICACHFVVEADGGVYPCDFYVDDFHRLGNVAENGFKEMFEGEIARRFVEESYSQAEKCGHCRWFSLCRGGCRRYRDADAEGSLGLNRLCGAYEIFFESCGERVVRLSSALFAGH